MELTRYPRTYHLEGSKGIDDPQSISFEQLKRHLLVIEEKMDGSMVSLRFNDDGELKIHHRNQEVRGPEFDLLKTWCAANEELLFELLEDKYVMYGEWLYARHTVPYTELPAFFLEFDILDLNENMFLSTMKRHEMLMKTGIHSVHVLGQGNYKRLEDVAKLADGPSRFGSPSKEGLYIKVETENFVLGRYKFIRKEFIDAILASGKHWSENQFTRNEIKENG